MNKYLAFIEAHPEAFKLLAVPLIFGIINFFTKPRTPEEYMKFHPRVAGLMKSSRGFFPDPQQTAEGLVQFLLGRVLSPEAKRASLRHPPVITEKKEP